MNHFHGVGSCTMYEDEPIIRDMINDSSSEDKDPEDMEDDVPANTIHLYHSNTTTTTNTKYELEEHMCFNSKDATVATIKQFHIQQGYKFMVVKLKIDRYVVRCIHYNNGCQWRLRASY